MQRTLLLAAVLLIFSATTMAMPWQYERTCGDTWTTENTVGQCQGLSQENDGGNNRLGLDGCNLSETSDSEHVEETNISTPVLRSGEQVAATCRFQLNDDGTNNKLFLFHYNGEAWQHIHNVTETGIGTSPKPEQFTRTIPVTDSGEHWIRCAITRAPDDIQQTGSTTQDYCATRHEDYTPLHDNDDTNVYVDNTPPTFPHPLDMGSGHVNRGQATNISFAVEDNSADWTQENRKKNNGTVCADAGAESCMVDDDGLQHAILTVEDPDGETRIEEQVSNLSTGTDTATVPGSTVDSAGTWNVSIAATDLAGHTTTLFETFTVSNALNVSFTGAAADTYSEDAVLPFEARDVNGELYDADWTVAVAGPNDFSRTFTSVNATSSYGFQVKQGWPAGMYTVDAAAERNGNTGNTTVSFDIGTGLSLTAANRDRFTDQSFPPAAPFSVYPVATLTQQGGDPVPGAQVWAACRNQDQQTHTVQYTETSTGTYEHSAGKCYTPTDYSTGFTVSLNAEKNGSTVSTMFSLTTQSPPENGNSSVATIPSVTVDTPTPGEQYYQSQHRRVPLVVDTDITATCEYSTASHEAWRHGEGAVFNQTGGTRHKTRYPPTSFRENTVFIKCWPEETRSGTTGKHAGKAQAQFIYIPETELNFTITEKNMDVTVVQGETRRVELFTARNTGTIQLPLSLTVTRIPLCCSLANLSRLANPPLGVQSTRTVHGSLTASLNASPGDYSFTVAAAAGERRDETTVPFTVERSGTVEQFHALQTRLAEARHTADRLQEQGLDTATVRTALQTAETRLGQAGQARNRDSPGNFAGNISQAATELEDAERSLLTLSFLGFLDRYKWSLLLFLLVVNLIGVAELYIVYPYLVLRDRLHTLQEKVEELIAEREEIEEQYFSRTLESSFEELLAEKQDELSAVRGKIRELDELLTVERLREHPKTWHDHMEALEEDTDFRKRLREQLSIAASWLTGLFSQDRIPGEEEPGQAAPPPVEKTMVEEAAASPGDDMLSTAEKRTVLKNVLEDAAPRIRRVQDKGGERRLRLHVEALKKAVDQAEDEEELDSLANEIKDFMEHLQDKTRDATG